MAQNFDDSMIAVSKLCCPVCWELLNILRNDGNFHVDGYHRILTQVELPEWLPLEIVMKLMARFKEILAENQDLERKPHTTCKVGTV
jgi:hypothetical protein